ncbi:response regulator [Alsobacter sp. SYSU BS001988]
MSLEQRPIVLLAEDDSLVAFTCEHELCDADFDVAGAFPSCSKALEWLAANTPDCAVLDVRLSQSYCTELANELTRRRVPIVVFSGYPEHACPVQFEWDAWVEKPNLRDLPNAIRGAISRASGPTVPMGGQVGWAG